MKQTIKLLVYLVWIRSGKCYKETSSSLINFIVNKGDLKLVGKIS